jgi:hypothetical protein
MSKVPTKKKTIKVLTEADKLKKIDAIKTARKNMKLIEEADAIARHDIFINNTYDDGDYYNVLDAQERQLDHYLRHYKDDYLPKRLVDEYEFPKYFYYTTNSKKLGKVDRRANVHSATFQRLTKSEKGRQSAIDQDLGEYLIPPVLPEPKPEPKKAPSAKQAPKSKQTPKSKQAPEKKSGVDLTGIKIIKSKESKESNKPANIITVADMPKKANDLKALKDEVIQLKRLAMMLSGSIDNDHLLEEIRIKEAEIERLEREASKHTKKK